MTDTIERSRYTSANGINRDLLPWRLWMKAKKLFWDMVGMGTWTDFVAVGHPLFTNLVWRGDEANLLKERARLGSARLALDEVHRKWEDLGFA